MAAGRNVIGILGPAAAVGLGFFVPTVFYGVQPTPDTTTQLRTPYLSPPFKFRNNQIDASQGMPLASMIPPAPPPFTPDLSDGPYSVRRFAPDQTYPNLVLLSAYVAGQNATLRNAVLTPPAKPRNNQIDASQPLNLPLQPVVANPFIPVDYNVTHDVISSPPQATPYNINIFTNPIPFGPYDYSEGPTQFRLRVPDQQERNALIYTEVPVIPVDYNIAHRVVSSPPQPQPYNINVYVNPIPFGPYDYSEGPTQFRLRVPDPVIRNPNIFSEVPFVPVDYNIPHGVQLVPPRVVSYNILIYSEVPFIPPDLSDGVSQFRVRLPDQVYPNIALTTVVTVTMPFGPFDWSKASAIKGAPPAAAPPYNPNLFTNPIPFGPYDYSVGPIQFRVRIPDPIERNPNIFSEVPFVPVDYNIAHAVVKSPPQPQPYNPNLLTNPIPFGPFDYNIAHTVISSPPQAAPYNINIFVNPVPFGPFDWTGRPPQMPARAPDQIARNPDIFSEVPTVPIDWSARPQQFPPRAPDQIYPNITINVTPPPPTPFAQYDWSKPFYPRVLKDNAPQTNINLLTNPIPLGPYDLSYRPSQYPPRAPDQIKRNPLIFSEVPIIPFDWSARPPQAIPRAPDVFHRNPLIFSEVPLINVDFSRPVRFTAPPVVPAAPYNLSIYSPPFPPTPVDFSVPRRVSGLPPQPQPYNIALLTPTGPAPFIPIDWSKPFAVRQAALQAQLNLTLTLPPPPPAPIVPFDWNRPYAVRLSPPQPQPNLTLFLPPPAVIGVPALCFSKDVPVNVSRAYDTTTQQAKAVDFRLYKASAVDQGTAKAQSKDVLLFTAKANTTPAGQDWSGAGYMAQYEIDTAIELQGVFINALTGVYIDPTAITLLVLDPSGAQTTYTWPSATIVRDSIGHFHQIITPAKSGLWTYKWQGTGAAVATSPDTTFTINSSALIPG